MGFSPSNLKKHPSSEANAERRGACAGKLLLEICFQFSSNFIPAVC